MVSRRTSHIYIDPRVTFRRENIMSNLNTIANMSITEQTSEAVLQMMFDAEYHKRPEVTESNALKAARGIPATDLDIARFIKTVFGDLIHYVKSGKTTGDWYVWDGTIHILEPSGELAVRIVDSFIDSTEKYINMNFDAEVFGEPEEGAKKSPTEFAVNEARKAIKSLKGERNAETLRSRLRKQFSAPAEWLDQDRDFIVFADGQVLSTLDPAGPLMPADPKRPVTRKMGITLGPAGVKPSQFLKSFEDRWIAPDVQLYLQWAAGAAMLGRGDAKHIVTLVGLGGTGKSSYINSMMLAFGGYAKSISPGAIVAKSTNFEQHDARGARFLRLEEPVETKTDDSFLKNLAGGGGEVPTQQKGRDIVHWKAQCVLFIAANHIPKFNTTDDAIVSRMNLVGFNRKFTDDDGVFEKDIEVRILEEEGPAIARWILDGAIAYHNHGKATFPLAQSMKDASASNVSESTPALKWLMEKFEDGSFVDGRTFDQDAKANPSNMVVNSKITYALFSEWAESDGYEKRRIPNKSKWASEINTFMGEPVVESTKRPGGYSRLWNVLPALEPTDLRGIKNMQTTSPIQMMEDGTGKFF